MGAVTVSIYKKQPLGGTSRNVLADVTFSGTYAAGGDTYTASQFGMSVVNMMIPQGDAVGSATTGYAVSPDITNSKIRLLGGAASGVAHAETATAAQTGTVARILVIGDRPMSELAPEAAPAEVTPAEPVAEPEWTGPSRDEWEQTQAQLSQYAELIQQQQQPQQPQEQELRPPDPWAEDYPQQLEAYVDAKLSFVQQLQQQMEIQEGREAALAFLEKDSASNGPLTDPARVWDQAYSLVRSGQVPAPQNDRETQQLLADLARQQREYDKKVGEAYHQQQLEQMQTIAGGPRRLPPQAAPGAAQTVPAGGYGNVPHAVADRFFNG